MTQQTNDSSWAPVTHVAPFGTSTLVFTETCFTGNAQFGGTVTANKVSTESLDTTTVNAEAVNVAAMTADTLQVQSISTPLVHSVQPARYRLILYVCRQTVLFE